MRQKENSTLSPGAMFVSKVLMQGLVRGHVQYMCEGHVVS